MSRSSSRSVFALLRLLLGLLLISGAACVEPPPVNDDDKRPQAPVTREIATWNMRFFPSSEESVARAASVIVDESWDLLAMQEVFEAGAVDDLLAALPGYEAMVFPEPTGQTLSVGILWRSDAFTFVDGGPLTVLAASFARTPMEVVLEPTGTGTVIRFVAVHLSSGIEATAEAARLREVAALEDHLHDDVVAGQHVVILGDYNEAPSDPRYDEVLAPFFAAPDLYTVISRDLQQPADATFLPAGVILDQTTVSTSLLPFIPAGAVDVVHLEDRFDDYEAVMSDHLPLHFTLEVPALGQ